MSAQIEKLKKVLELNKDSTEHIATKLMISLFSTVSDHIYIKSAPGIFLVSNSAHHKFMGGEIAGRTVYDFFPRAIARSFEMEDKRVLETDTPSILTERRPDRTFNIYEMTTIRIPLHDATGTPCGLLIFSVNVTPISGPLVSSDPQVF